MLVKDAGIRELWEERVKMWLVIGEGEERVNVSPLQLIWLERGGRR